jgi:hypothetical protein
MNGLGVQECKETVERSVGTERLSGGRGAQEEDSGSHSAKEEDVQ